MKSIILLSTTLILFFFSQIGQIGVLAQETDYYPTAFDETYQVYKNGYLDGDLADSVDALVDAEDLTFSLISSNIDAYTNGELYFYNDGTFTFRSRS